VIETRYQVLFDATPTGEFDLETTKGRFAKLFGLKQRVLERLFAGKDLVIKKDLSEGDARRFATTIMETGCESVVIEEEGTNYGEERRNGERRMRYHRDTKPGLTVADRREYIRRQEDIERSEELILERKYITAGSSSYKPYR
jgi:hypothetical protein